MIKRPLWYLINGKLFSPDGTIEVTVVDDKISDIQNMVIKEPALLTKLDGVSSITFDRGRLTATKHGKNIVICSDILLGSGDITSTVKEMAASSAGALSVTRGENLTDIYKEIVRLSIPGVNSLMRSIAKMSYLHNGIAMVGSNTHIDFILMNVAHRTVPLHIVEFYPYIHERADDFTIFQDDSGSESEIVMNIKDVKRRKVKKEIEEIVRREIFLRAVFSPKGKNTIDKAYMLYELFSSNPGEPIMEYSGEVYNEISKAITKDQSVLVEEDGTHVVGATITQGRNRIQAADTRPTTAIRLPDTAFGYSVEKDGFFQVYLNNEHGRLIFKTVNKNIKNVIGITTSRAL